MKKDKPILIKETPKEGSIQRDAKVRSGIESFTKPTTEFTKALADEIVRGLTSFREFTSRSFNRPDENHELPMKDAPPFDPGEHPILVDSSILIDARILPIVNSGFLTGTLLIPQFVLAEVQHIADSSDTLRRTKGRRGLDVANKLRSQRVNGMLKTKVISEDVPQIPEVDHKLVALAKKWHARLMTVDFNLAHVARAQGVPILNVTDLATALRISLVPGEELSIKITHVGKEREQGVGYLSDGTMIVVDNAKDNVGTELMVVVTKIHNTPAGQLFFARLK